MPLLYDEIFITSTYSAIDKSRSIASQFAPHIKTLRITFLQYRFYAKNEFAEERKNWFVNRDLTRIDGHLEYAFEVYTKAWKEHSEILEQGELMATLCYILTTSKGLKKIVLTDWGSLDGEVDGDPAIATQHLCGLWGLEYLCPYRTCNLSEADHLTFFDHPTTGFGEPKITPWSLVIVALSTSNASIPEIVVRTEGVEGCMPNAHFAMSPRQNAQARNQLQNLTKLRLSIWFPPNIAFSHDAARALCAATNLKILFVESDHVIEPSFSDQLTKLPALLEGCRFPKLQSLMLIHLDTKENELLRILQTLPTIVHLTIVALTLNDGTWAGVAQRLRGVLPLQSMVFHDLYGGWGDLQDWKNRDVDPREVNKFFFSGGRNPFNEDALGQWREVGDFERSEITQSLEDYEERYDLFH